MLDLKFKALVNRIRNKELRVKTAEFLENPTFEIGGKRYEGLPLEVAPAGLSHHHAYVGGFVEHVVSTGNLALALCDCVEKVYGGKVNRDVVLAGVLLHDALKPVTYVANEDGSYSSAALADFMDHLSLVTAELVRKGFPLEVVHVVCAHHGAYGPIRPRSVEALVCHLADLADSRLNGEVLSAAGYLVRRAVGEELRGLSSKEAFEVVYSKQVEGWAGVAKIVEKIKQRRGRKSRKA